MTADHGASQAVARLDAGDLRLIESEADRWLAECLDYDGEPPGNRAAFIAGAAWATQWRWE